MRRAMNGNAQLFPGLAVVNEKDRQAAILAYLKKQGVVHSVTDTKPVIYFENGEKRFSKRVSEKGWPDITAVLPSGRFWGIEVKSGDGRLSPEQKTMRDRIEQSGGVYTVAQTVNDVAAVLACEDNESN